MLRMDVYEIVLKTAGVLTLTTYYVANDTASGAITALYTQLGQTQGSDSEVHSVKVALQEVYTVDEVGLTRHSRRKEGDLG